MELVLIIESVEPLAEVDIGALVVVVDVNEPAAEVGSIDKLAAEVVIDALNDEESVELLETIDIN